MLRGDFLDPAELDRIDEPGHHLERRFLVGDEQRRGR